MDRDLFEYVVKLKCPDQPGILAQLTSLLWSKGCDIREADVYGDPQTQTFFVRMQMTCDDHDREALTGIVAPVARALDLDYTIFDLKQKMRVVAAVSKFDHCLNDILHKWKIGVLPIDIKAVVSNHDDLRGLADRYGVAYHHLPVRKETKPQQEAAFAKIIDDNNADLVVLARYMQVLSDAFSRKLSGKCINIHHSFLPSFKGAKPYHQAHARGVKLIGATAHYVTQDLDEGPIIEQDVRRVSHSTTVEDMIAIGREVEASVLSRAIKWHSEYKVFLNGEKTVVF